MKKTLLYLLTASTLLTSCKAAKLAKDARDDARKFALAIEEQSLVPHQILVDAETVPVHSEITQDSADDPAIYHNSDNPENSIIIGTNKKKGLHTYNLQGQELDFVECGKVNNVNVREGFVFNGEEIVLVAASNRTTQGISLFSLDKEDGTLTQIGEVKTSNAIDDVYGFTMYKSATTNIFYAIINGKNGILEQYKLFEKENKIDGTLVKTRKVASQPEGMVVDEQTGKLYVGVEELYIQIFNVEPTAKDQEVMITSSMKKNNPFIEYDIEGLALFKYKEITYLIASIQGSFSYAIFDVTTPNKDAKYITSFSIIGNTTIDGAEETDGLEVSTANFGRQFPEGILVVQDGFNKTPKGEAEAQNFKIIDVRKLFKIIN